MSGADLIAAERKRQIKKEGWTAEHDGNYQSGELNDAAICYAAAAAKQARGETLSYLHAMTGTGMIPWPWEDRWWKPSTDPIRNLVKAGALIAAEIDRIQHALPANAHENGS